MVRYLKIVLKLPVKIIVKFFPLTLWTELLSCTVPLALKDLCPKRICKQIRYCFIGIFNTIHVDNVLGQHTRSTLIITISKCDYMVYLSTATKTTVFSNI